MCCLARLGRQKWKAQTPLKNFCLPSLRVLPTTRPMLNRLCYVLLPICSPIITRSRRSTWTIAVDTFTRNGGATIDSNAVSKEASRLQALLLVQTTTKLTMLVRPPFLLFSTALLVLRSYACTNTYILKLDISSTPCRPVREPPGTRIRGVVLPEQ